MGGRFIVHPLLQFSSTNIILSNVIKGFNIKRTPATRLDLDGTLVLAVSYLKHGRFLGKSILSLLIKGGDSLEMFYGPSCQTELDAPLLTRDGQMKDWPRLTCRQIRTNDRTGTFQPVRHPVSRQPNHRNMCCCTRRRYCPHWNACCCSLGLLLLEKTNQIVVLCYTDIEISSQTNYRPTSGGYRAKSVSLKRVKPSCNWLLDHSIDQPIDRFIL